MDNWIIDRPIRAASEPHVALSLVLDVSGSMHGEAINLLNSAVNKMTLQMKSDSQLKNIVDLAIFVFGTPTRQHVYQGFRAIADCETVRLEATDTSTYVIPALDSALSFTQKRCVAYDKAGGAYKPWIVLITDGEFHDDRIALDDIGQKMKEREMKGKLQFFGLGVEQYDRMQLEKLTNNPAHIIDAKVANFAEFFSWIGKSMKVVSTKAVGEPATLPPLQFTV